MSDRTKDAALARRLLGMLDLTTLNDSDDDQVIRALAANGVPQAQRLTANLSLRTLSLLFCPKSVSIGSLGTGTLRIVENWQAQY